MYSDLQVQQVQATVESKITLQAYSRYLKDLYGMRNYCRENVVGALLLLRFAIGNWDNRVGAITNPYSQYGLNNIIKRINAI